MRDEDKTKEQLIAELRVLRRGSGANLREACVPTVLDHIPLIILILDCEGRVRLVNRHGEQTLGWAVQGIRGRDLLSACFPDPDTCRRARDFFQAAAVDWCEFATTARYGCDFDISWTVVRTPGGETIAIGHDVTQRNRTEIELRRNEALFAEAQHLALIGSWNWDLATDILYWSDEHYRIFGIDARERPMTYRRAIGLVHSDDREVLEGVVRQAVQDTQPHECRMRVCLEDGTVRYVLSRGQAVFDEAGLPVRLFGTSQDITERVMADQALEDSRGRFRAVFENALDGILLIDNAGRYVDANPAICRLLGYDRDALLAMTVRDVSPHEIRDRIPELLGQFLAAGTLSGEYTMLGNGEVALEVEYRSVANIRPGLHLGIHRDITERKQAQEALAKNSARLQALSRRLVEVQEEERRHLARELHDEIGQLLTGIKFSLDAVAADSGPAGAKLAQAQTEVADALARVRELAFDLRPALLDHLGLIPALRELLRRYTATTGVRVDFHHAGVDRRLPPAVETAAYRIVQEALTNVARHAQVEDAAVRIRVDGGTLEVQVEDQGVGYDPEAGSEAVQSSGLMGMHERVTLLGGRLVVESQTGAGTHLIAELPLGESPGEP